jgi:hypothetical protein
MIFFINKIKTIYKYFLLILFLLVNYKNIYYKFPTKKKKTFYLKVYYFSFPSFFFFLLFYCHFIFTLKVTKFPFKKMLIFSNKQT